MISHLSIVYITLNAEAYLEESLLAAKQLTTNILIIDSGSTDKTLTICDELSIKTRHKDWLGFAAQKQYAIDQASHDWVLFLDADEVLTVKAINEIHALFQTTLTATAYSLPRENWFQDKWIQHGSWSPDKVTRLIHRTQGKMKPVLVHECWETTGKIIALKGAIKHYSYSSYSELMIKADKYSSLGAQQLFINKKTCSQWSPLTHGFASFIRLFLLKRGYKDGIEGAAIAYTTAMASFMKYAKLQELYRQQNSHQE
ncbi:MAG: glycosyltransferase family 2 protein [Thiotrichaceae bacterium]|nr:glycosyltransferase family 2 protein [Thiotrichaceae bacterium]